MTEEGTLKDEIRKINENLEKLTSSGKVKGFKPNKKLTNSDLKKNYILGIIIGENKEIKFLKLPVSEGTTTLEGSPRLATKEYLLTYRGKPAIILPEASCKPYCLKEELDEDAKNNLLAVGYRLLMNRQEQGELKAKKGISSWMILIIVAAIGVAAYFLLS